MLNLRTTATRHCPAGGFFVLCSRQTNALKQGFEAATGRAMVKGRRIAAGGAPNIEAP